MKPREIEVNVLGMTFFTLARDSLTVKPISGLPGMQYLQFVNEYRAALEQIINPIRSQYGLLPYAMN